MTEPVIVDTGPLVALLSRRDQYHELAKSVFASMRSPLITTWPVMTEAAWLLRNAFGGVDALFRLVEEDAVRLAELGPTGPSEIRSFLQRFESARPQVADASLVVLAQRRQGATILTFDRRDFAIYRTQDGRPLDIVPQ